MTAPKMEDHARRLVETRAAHNGGRARIRGPPPPRGHYAAAAGTSTGSPNAQVRLRPVFFAR